MQSQVKQGQKNYSCVINAMQWRQGTWYLKCLWDNFVTSGGVLEYIVLSPCLGVCARPSCTHPLVILHILAKNMCFTVIGSDQ